MIKFTTWVCWLGWSLLFLIGCRPTDTPAGIPVWQGSYFLRQADSVAHLAIWQGGLLRPAAETNWIPPGALLQDIAAEEDQLWLLSQSPAGLQQIDLATERSVMNLSDLPLLHPRHLALGPDNILVGDSIARQLVFWLPKGEKWVEVSPAAAPGEILYRAGYYYVATAAPAVEVWHAQALSRIKTLPFDAPIISLQADARNTVWVQTRQTNTLYEAGIEINSRTLQPAAAPTPFLARQHSPFIRRQFGTEYTRPVLWANDSVIRPGNIRGTPDFETDFLSGDIYYTRADSLYRFSINENRHEGLAAFQGALLDLYTWWDFGLK